ncbi:unnamed protein product [Linum tenue]|uniref:Uncharacterized protein n=1 Tax=Linum tenue TaxID=586396 RepID=A0AAV0JKM5_9ROSI|nr:unnamed protein product [Linum tenue]
MADVLTKVGLFVIVQALVYLVLTTSSTVFSRNLKRSFSFKPARSVSIRRIFNAISDAPVGEPSPRTTSSSSSSCEQQQQQQQQLDPIFGDVGYAN